MNESMNTAVRKIAEQQAREQARSHVWHCGEHLKGFLEEHPEYADLISVDLDNPEMSLRRFESAIAKAARENGGAIGGRDADTVLRKFYGLPEEAPASPLTPSVSGMGGTSAVSAASNPFAAFVPSLLEAAT